MDYFSDNIKLLGERFFSYLTREGINYSAYSRFLDVSPDTIKRWVKKDVRPFRTTLASIATKFTEIIQKEIDSSIIITPDMLLSTDLGYFLSKEDIGTNVAYSLQEVEVLNRDFTIYTISEGETEVKALQVVDDSMEPLMSAGDFIIFNAKAGIELNKYAVYLPGTNNFRIGKAISIADRILLRPSNIEYNLVDITDYTKNCHKVIHILKKVG